MLLLLSTQEVQISSTILFYKGSQARDIANNVDWIRKKDYRKDRWLEGH